MTKLEWNRLGERLYESGVDRGVLFVEGASAGVPWNGLTGLRQRATGAERTPKYIDGVKVQEETNTEEFQATIEALTYPPEFADCIGLPTDELSLVQIGTQNRKSFGLAYRTRVGNDINGLDYGYQIHLVYGCTAMPSPRAYRTIANQSDPVPFSWDLDTLPIPVDGYLPTSHLIFDSNKLYQNKLVELEGIIFGTEVSDSRMPTPQEIIDIIAAYKPVVLVNNTALVPRVNLHPNPRARGDVGFGSSGGQAHVEVPDVSPRFVLESTSATAIGMSVGLTLVTGQSYRVLVKARANRNIEVIKRVRATQVPTPEVLETEWKWFDWTAVAGSGTGTQTGFLIQAGDGAPGDWVEIEKILIADGGDTGPWFWAGSSPGLILPGIYMHELLGVRDPRLPGDLIEIKPGIYERTTFSSLIETSVDGLYKLEG